MIGGLVLAGGQGRRLGGADKALLPLAGRPLLDHLLDRLRPQVGPIAVSANGDAGRFTPWGLPVLADAAAEGPLAGLLAGLRWAEEQGIATLLSVPVDTPLVPGDLARRLWPPPARAASAGRVHHLVALWPVSEARRAVAALLASPGSRAAAALGDRLGARSVPFAPHPAPFAPDPFFNINTRADLLSAEQHVACA